MSKLLDRLRDLRRYPALATGLIIILIFCVLSIYAVIAIPYGEAVEAWRDPTARFDYPRFARPVWFDWFTSDALPRTIMVGLEGDGATLIEEPLGEGTKRVEAVLPFDYQYDRFPSELQMRTHWTYADPARRAMVTLYWRKPDGEIITVLEGLRSKASQTFYISSDSDLRDRLGARPEQGLFFLDTTVPEDQWEPMKGNYELIIVADMQESDSLDTASLTVYGRISGVAGTDHLRRDLLLPLLWGAPIALLFGIFAAVGAQVSTFVLAGIGTWFAGRLEKAMVWLTQVNNIIPILPILIMISHLYQPRLWTILGIVIAFNVFSASFFTYRAMFLQLKEAPYFEAAQAYGAGNFRIIFRYLLPRIAPTLLPQFVMIIPTFVFLEATLAVLGLGDPFLPTWGKLIRDARVQSGLYFGHYYWMLQPALLLMAMGCGFALVGYSLDRIFNPRLREL